MKLYLVQHGEALSKEQDPQRPLSQKGITDIERIGGFLRQAAIGVDKIIHSGKFRAQQTADIIASHIDYDTEPEITGIINPNDSPETFAWQSDSWEDDTLIVGHLPFLARLISHLIIKQEQQLLVAFQPGTVVCLECSEDKTWLINWMLRPELLKK